MNNNKNVSYEEFCSAYDKFSKEYVLKILFDEREEIKKCRAKLENAEIKSLEMSIKHKEKVNELLTDLIAQKNLVFRYSNRDARIYTPSLHEDNIRDEFKKK